MLDWPLVTSEVRMFSMEVAVRAQLPKAKSNAVATRVPVVLNMEAGNEARLVRFAQVAVKLVPEAVLTSGHDVRLEQPPQADVKFVPAPVLINGNVVRLLQPPQAAEKFVTLLVLIRGKLARLVQFAHALLRVVAPLILINGNVVRLEHCPQADDKLVPPDASSVASTTLRALQPVNAVFASTFMLAGAGPIAITRGA